MSKTAYTAFRTRGTVALTALFLSAVALVAGSATTLGHGAGVSVARSGAISTVTGSVPCAMCGG